MTTNSSQINTLRKSFRIKDKRRTHSIYVRLGGDRSFGVSLRSDEGYWRRIRYSPDGIEYKDVSSNLYCFQGFMYALVSK
jgi:hypothetical protein